MADTVGRIEQLTEALGRCNPFHIVQLPAGLLDLYINEAQAEVNRRLAVGTLTDEERMTVRHANIGGSPEADELVRIIERLTGERLLEGDSNG